MGTSASSKIITVLVFFLIAAVVGVSFSIDAPLIERYQRSKEKRAELQNQNNQLKEKLAELRSNQERFRTDPEFVERLARKNRRLRPGEVVFVFDTPEED